MRPVIGVTCAWTNETWGNYLTEEGFYYTDKAVLNAIYGAGGLPFLIPPHYKDESVDKDTDDVLNLLDGIFFTGGGYTRVIDLENPPELKAQQPRRSLFEAKLIVAARKMKMPTMGVCRGYQMIVDVFGGEFGVKPIMHHKQKAPSCETWHKVELNPNSRLFDIIGVSEWDVNSLHTRGVEKAPEGFTVAAVSPDGVIECVEAYDSFMIGFQFHPEYLLHDEKAANIFRCFLNEAINYKKQKKS